MLSLSGSFCLIQDLAWLSEQDMRLKLREVRECGIDTLIPTLAAEHGQSLVPLRVLPVASESTFNYRYRRVFERIKWAHQHTRDACAAAGKRYWANIELFNYDQSGHPTNLRTAPPARVLRQIEVASKHAQRLSSFQYFGIIDARDSKVPLGGDGSVELHDAIRSHNDLVAPSGICSA